MKVDQGGQARNEGHIDKLKPTQQAAKLKHSSSSSSVDPPISRQAVRAQRIAAAKNLILSAFESVKAWLEAEDGRGEGTRLIADLYDKTRLQNEHVLEPYMQQLASIVEQRDKAQLAELMAGTRAEIKLILPEPEKSSVADQNRLAAQSELGAEGIEVLMQRVVRDLKGSEGPTFSLTRERVIDLLG